MTKDYMQEVSVIPMYSKVGRYISNKLLKYNKEQKKQLGKQNHKAFTQRTESAPVSKIKNLKGNQSNIKSSQTQRPINKSNMNNRSFQQSANKQNNASMSQLKKKKQKGEKNKFMNAKNMYHTTRESVQPNNSSFGSNFANNNISKRKQNLSATQYPSVGHYKVNYSQNQKNIHSYNFDRSVPHFARDKYHCQETTSYHKDMPDGFQMNSKGFKELKRMAGRNQIKGSVRKNIENPHQMRYIKHDDYRQVGNLDGYRKSSNNNIKLANMLSRDKSYKKLFKSIQNTPQYDYNFQINKKKLNSHIIPFERQTDRSKQTFQCKSGISSYYNNNQSINLKLNSSCGSKSVLWQKVLNRQPQGYSFKSKIPSYMNKTIHSRLVISLGNLKALEMNCSDINVEGYDKIVENQSVQKLKQKCHYSIINNKQHKEEHDLVETIQL